ncbi:TPA: IdeS/Mac family cysteine endopeptidase, partial [Streptococcus suis]|nr:IdeS/Mac family cysteine endopeptidase [Streptococcus suis]
MDIHIRFSLRKLAVGLVPVTFLFLANQSVLSAQAETISSLEEETSLLEGDLVPQSLEIINVEEQGEKNNSEFTGLNILVESDNLAQGSENEVGPSELKNELLEVKIDNLFESTSIEIHADMEEKVIPEHEDSSLPSNLPVAVQKDVVEQPISLYTSEDGQYREIIWAQGITPPSMGQGGDFKKEVTGEFIEYTMPYEAGNGYYDANKSLDASIEDLNLCFAAVSSNMLHWWLEQNKEYVERYISEKYGADLGQQDYSLTDIRRYTDSFENQQNSRIFNLFKAYYGRRLNGFVSDALVDLFINGYPPKSQGGVNLENPDLVPDKRGGFFHEVFKEKMLTDRMFSGDYLYFGNLVRNNLENQGLLGLTYRTFGTTTHIVTVWGAEYDEKGLIRAVYITDSDDQHHPIGLKRMGITRDSSGKPRLNNNVVKNSFGSHLDYVHTIRLGQDLWEEYFNPLAKAKETASQTLADTKKALDLSIQGQSELPESMRLIYLEKLNNLYNQGILSIQKAESSEMLSGALENGLNSLKSLDFPISKVGNALAPDLPVGNRSTVSDVDSLSSQETSSTNLEVDTENASLIADGTNQLHFPVEVQTTSSVEAEGDNVFEQEADTLPIIIENKDEFGSELSRNMQTSETDSLVVVVEEDVKNDEVVPVEELLESETVENQRSELLSGPIGMEEVNVKEETQVAPVVTEQPATSKTTTVEASFDESASVESETVAQPAPTSSPGRSALPVQPEVTEVASQEEDQVATTATEQPATSKTTTVEASLDEPASVESETVAQPAPTSSPGRSAIPVQPEVTEVASQEEVQV